MVSKPQSWTEKYTTAEEIKTRLMRLALIAAPSPAIGWDPRDHLDF